MTRFDELACRRQFPGLARLVNGRPAAFLDGPGGSQVPQSVIDAVADCLTHRNANDGGAFATSRDAGAVVDAARDAIADLLGASDPDEVVFGPNMTTLTFSLSRALARTWRPGDEVVVTRLDHDANVTPWVLAAADAGATARFLDIDPRDCTLRLDLLPTLLNERTNSSRSDWRRTRSARSTRSARWSRPPGGWGHWCSWTRSTRSRIDRSMWSHWGRTSWPARPTSFSARISVSCGDAASCWSGFLHTRCAPPRIPAPGGG